MKAISHQLSARNSRERRGVYRRSAVRSQLVRTVLRMLLSLLSLPAVAGNPGRWQFFDNLEEAR